jgi:transglutaminase-like putative cysteine protease
MGLVIRNIGCHLELTLSGPSELVFSVSAAAGLPLAAESLVVTAAGQLVTPKEVLDDHGTRLHLVRADVGSLVLDYRATIDGVAPPAEVTDVDRLRYLRQSRYCEADSLTPTAAAEFAGLTGPALLFSVAEWVNQRISYVSGSSTGTDSALDTLLARQGVCRDFAHLVIALLRALGVPARLAAVYAPGLSPMEFHAVAEALVDGQWWVVDATKLAPRQSLLRVATGRDAADTAFLTNFGAATTLTGLEVTAVVDDFQLDNTDLLTQLR